MTIFKKTGAAALLAGLMISAIASPASAGVGLGFGFGGGGGWNDHHHGHHGGGIYVDVSPSYVDDDYDDEAEAHVRWCAKRYQSYNPVTDYFMSKHGPRRCDSPFN